MKSILQRNPQHKTTNHFGHIETVLAPGMPGAKNWTQERPLAGASGEARCCQDTLTSDVWSPRLREDRLLLLGRPCGRLSLLPRKLMQLVGSSLLPDLKPPAHYGQPPAPIPSAPTMRFMLSAGSPARHRHFGGCGQTAPRDHPQPGAKSLVRSVGDG